MHTSPSSHSSGLRALERCLACDGTLVYPVEWEQLASGFAVLRRCPDCGVFERDEHPDDELERYDDVLDDGLNQLVASLAALSEERMREDCERFAVALRAGHILPEDF